MLNDDGKNIPEPLKEEVATANNKLKNNKAPGDDGVSEELFKAEEEHLANVMHKLIYYNRPMRNKSMS